MIVEPSIAGARAWRRSAPGPVALVPTMGFLHAGHISLVEEARRSNVSVAVSIFVNPSQFGPNEDLGSYPRDPERDLELLRAAGADFIFMPPPEEVYPAGFDTWVTPGAVADRLEGSVRPGHFRGVGTVVIKLFNIVQPDRAYFGQKDAQQLQVIRKMVADLNVAVEVIGLPTVRERDGLALSSRNVYLGPEERPAALVLSRALAEAKRLFAAGERSAAAVRSAMDQIIAAEPLAQPDYVSLADPVSLTEQELLGPVVLASLAVRIGRARLIDNATLRSD